MPVSMSAVKNAALTIASVENVEADAATLIEDAYFLSLAFSDETDYRYAVTNTVRALNQLVAQSVSTSALKHDHLGWHSYHYQHKVGQKTRADMRIIFRREGDKLRLRAFGHRNLPKDFYERVAQTR